jgi:hypothetical protein
MPSSPDLRSPGVLEAKVPVFSTSDAERVAGEIFGVDGSARLLESERDQNFQLRAEGRAEAGREFVLKIANPAEHPAVLDFQTRALLHIAARLAVGVVISAWRVRDHPENRDYIAGYDRPFWAMLERLADMDPGFVHCCFRAACGLSPCPTTPKLVAWLGDCAGSFGSVLELDLPAARKRRVPADAVLVGVPDAKRGLDEQPAPSPTSPARRSHQRSSRRRTPEFNSPESTTGAARGLLRRTAVAHWAVNPDSRVRRRPNDPERRINYPFNQY